MRILKPAFRYLFIAGAAFAVLYVICVIITWMPWYVSREYRQKVVEGRVIVHAIEACKKETGAYPISLSALVPKYLPQVPQSSDLGDHHWGPGWEYRYTADNPASPYILSYYVGRGGITYTAARQWTGIDDGKPVNLPDR